MQAQDSPACNGALYDSPILEFYLDCFVAEFHQKPEEEQSVSKLQPRNVEDLCQVL